MPTTYGTNSDTVRTIGAYDFIPFFPSTPYSGAGAGYRYLTGPGSWFAPVQLPNGAQLRRIGLSACDSSPVADVAVSLFSATKGAELETNHASVVSPTGCSHTVLDFPAPVTVNNNSRVYFLVVTMGTDDLTQFNAVTLSYRLQVGPPPPAASFNDVPVGNPLRPFVEALVGAGITTGCGNGNYCPDTPLTRGQMAVFLAAALGLHWPN